MSTEAKRHNYDTFSFGQIAPIRANNIFEDFWGNRFGEWDDVDDFFRPALRTRWSRNLDRMLNEGDEDWSNVK